MTENIFMRMKAAALWCVLLLLYPACYDNAQQQRAAKTPDALPRYAYTVVHAWPHDREAFTQGLVYHDGYLYESTGRNGSSSLRKVELQTGAVAQRRNVGREYFAEGMTIMGERIFQLTWQAQKGFIYDLASFRPLSEFAYTGEGWGLTHDADSLILSDGTDKIRFLDPATFRVVKTISVIGSDGRSVAELNELEYVNGEIFANIWHTDDIARIDPATGKITGWIDLTDLLPASERGSDADAVLNGIAYDPAGGRLFVTGKLWPKLYEIKLKKL